MDNFTKDMRDLIYFYEI